MSSSNNEATQAVVDVTDNLQFVRDKIQATCEKTGRPSDGVRLVAVSKTKPLDLLKQAYDVSQRIFGENYAQELVEKAGQMPADVEWHFIGSLQSNKANMLVKAVVPVSAKLTVETVSSLKLANKLNAAMDALDDDMEDKKLNIFMQVNTSGEDSKSGIEPSEVAKLAKEIMEQCPRLVLQGLMTIGAPGDVGCFDTLIQCRDRVCADLGLGNLELSMGMSDDFEVAIEKEATNVRIGSTIFGARNYSNSN
jgi:PLP dependent protein